MRGKEISLEEKQPADVDQEKPLNENNYTNVNLEVLSKQIRCPHFMQL